MQTNVIVFLDALLDISNSNRFNKERVKQLKFYTDDPNYKLLIYGDLELLKLKSSDVQMGLADLGLKTDQLRLYPTNSTTKYSYIQKDKAELAKSERLGGYVIVLGPVHDNYINRWVQESDFSIVDWPYGTKQTLKKLMDEQLYILDSSAFLESVSLPEGKNYFSHLFDAASHKFFPYMKKILDRNKRESGSHPKPSDCEELRKEIALLRDEIAVSRDHILNLTATIIHLELEQISLQGLQTNLTRVLLQSEATQTGLIRTLFHHDHLEYAVILLTSSHLFLDLFGGCIVRAGKKLIGYNDDQKESRTARNRGKIIPMNSTTTLLASDSSTEELDQLEKSQERTVLSTGSRSSSFFKKDRESNVVNESKPSISYQAINNLRYS